MIRLFILNYFYFFLKSVIDLVTCDDVHHIIICFLRHTDAQIPCFVCVASLFVLQLYCCHLMSVTVYGC